MTRENFDKAMELSNMARRIKDEMNYAASCMNRTMESEVSSMIKRSGMDNFLGRGEATRVIMDAIGQLYNEEVARHKEILADIDRQIAEL